MNLTLSFRMMAVLFLALLLNSGYIWAFASPTLFDVGNMIAHLVLGVFLAAAFAWQWLRNTELRRGTKLSALLFAGALGCGLYLAAVGNLSTQRRVLVAHIAAGLLGTLALTPFLWRAARNFGESESLLGFLQGRVRIAGLQQCFRFNRGEPFTQKQSAA